MKTPVVFVIFNRPDTAAKVFEAIRQARPSKLFVIADGPRQDKIGDADKCIETRSIIDQVDWDCEVIKNYSDINLGCGKRLPSGLDWVFQQVEEAIIFEDDCLPDISFFPYCEELLEKHRHDTRITMISGNNFQLGRRRTSDSYYFSHYGGIWGWATWRRAWSYNDVDMTLWNTIYQGGWLKDILEDNSAVKSWERIFQDVYEKKLNTCWDYQWVFTCWIQNGLAIVPSVNLVSNIGFGAGATHTTNKINELANLPVEFIPLPLKHPEFVLRDVHTDRYTQKKFYSVKLFDIIKNTINKYVNLF